MAENANRTSDTIFISFAPEQWGQVQWFRYFHSTTYDLGKTGLNALAAVEGHFQKYLALKGLAQRLAPTLTEGIQELNEHGHTPAIRS